MSEEMNDLIEEIKKIVISSSGLSSDLGPTSGPVIMTNGHKKCKCGRLLKEDVSGITTTIDGKKLRITNLTDKQKDEYLFGSSELQKSLDDLNDMISALESEELTSDEIDVLEKSSGDVSAIIKSKDGEWRRINGRPCFICSEGIIHAGPKAFIGKSVMTLRDDLREERKAKKAKKAK